MQLRGDLGSFGVSGGDRVIRSSRSREGERVIRITTGRGAPGGSSTNAAPVGRGGGGGGTGEGGGEENGAPPAPAAKSDPCRQAQGDGMAQVDGGVGTDDQVNNQLGSWTAYLNDLAFFLQKEEELEKLEKDQTPSADGETNRAPADEETKCTPAVEAKENKDSAPNKDKKEEDRKDDGDIIRNHEEDEDHKNDKVDQPCPTTGPLVGSHNRGVFGPADALPGLLGAALAPAGATAAGLEVCVSDGARPLVATARGNPGPKGGGARIYPRGMGTQGGGSAGTAAPRRHAHADGLAPSGGGRPDIMMKKLQIRPSAHRLGAAGAGGGALALRPGVPAQIDFSQIIDGGGKEAKGAEASSAALLLLPPPPTAPSAPLSTSPQSSGRPCRRSPPPPAAPKLSGQGPEAVLCPKLTRPGYTTEPPLAELAAMNAAALAALPAFAVVRRGVGAVRWEGGVDVRGLDLDALVAIEDRAVAVYEGVAEEEKPPLGRGLNRPALVTLEGVTPPVGVDGAKFVAKLERRTRKMGAEFVGYDAEQGVWRFRTQHF